VIETRALERVSVEVVRRGDPAQPGGVDERLGQRVTLVVVDAVDVQRTALTVELALTVGVILGQTENTTIIVSVVPLALFGPTASSTPTTVSGVPTSAVSVCSLTLRFNPAAPPRNTLPCEDVVSAETALAARAAEAGATVTWNNGQDVAAAAAQAADADVAIVFGYQRMGEFSDLTDLRLQGNGDALIAAVEQANPNTVVVLQTGTAVEMPWLGGVQAVLENWYGGEQQGPAIASLLFGDVAPTGKLPMTFPVALADTPTNTPEQYPGVFADGSTTRPPGSTEIRQVSYSEGLAVGYKWYQEQGTSRCSRSATASRTRRSRMTECRSLRSPRMAARRSA
jgi:beta-glucosidase